MTTATSKTIQIHDLTIDFSAVRSVFSSDGYTPRWGGKVALTFDNWIADSVDVVSANWSGYADSSDGKLCDFEGESDDAELYALCEKHAEEWAVLIAERIGKPSYWDAHQNDLRDRGIIAA